MESAPPLGKPELIARLRSRIHSDGPIPFSTFMAEALYAPGLGYYSSAPTLGPSGDFYTAPSIGPIFGRFLAWQIIETWNLLGSPIPFTLIEQGAHRGLLLADIVTEIARSQPTLAQHLSLILIEPDPARRHLQSATLASVGAQPAFLPHPADLPASLTGCFLANELPDSFPFDRARYLSGQWTELRVGWDPASQTFVEVPAPLRPELLPLLLREEPPDIEGFTIELCPELETWLPQLLSRFHTAHLLLFDYAFTRAERRSPARASGTLRTYFQHRLGDNPFLRIGQQDITCHVHATRLEELARAHHCTVSTLDQHRAFVGMIAAFLPDHSPRLLSLNPADRRALQTLTHPALMGRAFSTFSLRKGWPASAPAPSIERFAPPH